MATQPLNSVILHLLLLASGGGTASAARVFTFNNSCSHTVWPGTLSGNGAAVLGGGGFEMPANTVVAFQAPAGWSGRFWARTGCIFGTANGSGSCATGDCGGTLKCSAGGKTPATLAEFTLGRTEGDKDFYDVSLVDGYNIGVGVTAAGKAAEEGAAGDNCGYAGCVSDVNGRCPAELRVAGASGETVGCRSACEAFGGDQYCCTGPRSSPGTCGPTRYSQLFKTACPAAYSYAYDDSSSTRTCAAGADYLITFCPASISPAAG
ncbi:Pathogenesis-related protein 5 [Apostasia shenzhenica]|uniref:Pathogenesis-related protein 5 n=1 Tax=Apostasia shenzhenica TaxID=1088818 RepID=A0A2I0A262_9ASPA|nr:Pathogenesis-related protein 5 [Apostasia shenzhenica]